jgi:hypothetical protein
MGVALADGLQIEGIYVESDHPLRSLAVDALQSVSAGDAEDGHGSWLAQGKSFREQIGERCSLLHGGRSHVAFVVGQRDGEPGIGHDSMLSDLQRICGLRGLCPRNVDFNRIFRKEPEFHEVV